MPIETEEPQTESPVTATDAPAVQPVTPDYAPHKTVKHDNFDPDHFRMTLGEHLEELRWRLMLGLGAFFPIAFVCLVFGRQLVSWFIRPLILGLARHKMATTVFFTETAES